MSYFNKTLKISSKWCRKFLKFNYSRFKWCILGELSNFLTTNLARLYTFPMGIRLSLSTSTCTPFELAINNGHRPLQIYNVFMVDNI